MAYSTILYRYLFRMNHNNKIASEKSVFSRTTIIGNFKVSHLKNNKNAVYLQNMSNNRVYSVPLNFFTNPGVPYQGVFQNELPLNVREFINQYRNNIYVDFKYGKYQQHVNPITSANKGSLNMSNKNISYGNNTQRVLLGQKPQILNKPGVPPKPNLKPIMPIKQNSDKPGIISRVSKVTKTLNKLTVPLSLGQVFGGVKSAPIESTPQELLNIQVKQLESASYINFKKGTIADDIAIQTSKIINKELIKYIKCNDPWEQQDILDELNLYIDKQINDFASEDNDVRERLSNIKVVTGDYIRDIQSVINERDSEAVNAYELNDYYSKWDLPGKYG